MLIFYYDASADKMRLRNTEPSKEWMKTRGNHKCEFLVTGRISVEKGYVSIVPQGAFQKVTAQGLRIDPIGEEGDEYDD